MGPAETCNGGWGPATGVTRNGKQRGLGQPPLRIIGDPYVEFCGQHAAKLMPNGHLLLYDNGWNCRPDPATGLSDAAPTEEFSRAVEYALDLDRGTATFVRHHSLHHSFSVLQSVSGPSWPRWRMTAGS